MNAETSTSWPIIGHDGAVDFLQRTLKSGRTRHAYLFIGPQDIGKRQLALTFAMALNCETRDSAAPCQNCRSCQLIANESSPDLFFTKTSGSSDSLLVKEIRRISAFLALQPYEMRHRIAVLDHFERAAPIAQDALLKTLEEPPPYALLFLIARDESSILPTILSRCQHLRLRPIAPELLAEQLISQYGASTDQALKLAHISGGRPGWAIRAFHDPTLLDSRTRAITSLKTCLGQSRQQRFELAERLAKDKSALEETLHWWQSYWRDVLLLSIDASHSPTNWDQSDHLRALAKELNREEILRPLRATRKLSDRLSINLNLRLAIEVLLLAYPRLPRYDMRAA